ncbi:hypothetical protein DPMN_160142 [Dreissena polymorpha]|uniref:Galaxin-like repeats domain-containing protein n=1 Tax=Dreissena polymorpha TaxID=45954 RepID=A0A9D4ELR4_DREPO|nr:hypothetical protein DPMN_160142 [Dreissena polymorpha]
MQLTQSFWFEVTCEGRVIKSEGKICCDDTINDRVAGPYTQCCGNISYDPSQYTCCEGTSLQELVAGY